MGSPQSTRTISDVTAVRVLGAFGKTVIALGLITLLFGIFQLWGTGIIEARAQQDLDSEFSDLLDASSSLVPPAPNSIVSATPEPTATATPQPTEAPLTAEESDPIPTTPSPTPTATPEPTPSATPEPHPAWLAMLYRDRGSAIGRIQIPSIDVDKTVVEGVRVSDLRKGPGHFPTTPMPGQTGNAAIAGHRTTYGAPFGEIDQVIPGDEIVVTTIQGQFTYQVVEQGDGHGHLIVPPKAVEVLDQDFRDHPNRLTLTACHPKGSARQRIIVVAELVGDPAPTYARPGQQELGEPQLPDEDLDEPEDSQQTVTATPNPEPAEDAATPTATPDTTKDPATPTAATDPTEEAATPLAATPSAEDVTGPDPMAEEAESAVGRLGLSDDSEAGGTGTQAVAAPIAEPAPVADSFGEGLDGDSDALIPAILWGLAALAIWFSALFAGHRWRKLPAYALSALPFLVVLFMAFWQIDRILPSY